jgi:hypothetical protein
MIPSRQRRAKTSVSKRFWLPISAMHVEPLETMTPTWTLADEAIE